eukprot:5175870-Pleurochrysis_carterae.AAC.1
MRLNQMCDADCFITEGLIPSRIEWPNTTVAHFRSAVSVKAESMHCPPCAQSFEQCDSPRRAAVRTLAIWLAAVTSHATVFCIFVRSCFPRMSWYCVPGSILWAAEIVAANAAWSPDVRAAPGTQHAAAHSAKSSSSNSRGDASGWRSELLERAGKVAMRPRQFARQRPSHTITHWSAIFSKAVSTTGENVNDV